MLTRFWLSLGLIVLIAESAAAQDVRSVLQTAATAIGVADMESIRYSGTGWQGRVGQNVAPAQDWYADDRLRDHVLQRGVRPGR